MTKDMVMTSVSKEVRDVKIALWEGFQRLARKLPDHHVLAVDLIRTQDDRTAALFTIVKGGVPYQTIVTGDAQGRVDPKNCGPRIATDPVARAAMAARLTTADSASDGVTADTIVLGEPPPKQEPADAVVVSLATVMLASAFNVGEQLTADPQKA